MKFVSPYVGASGAAWSAVAPGGDGMIPSAASRPATDTDERPKVRKSRLKKDFQAYLKETHQRSFRILKT